MGDNKESGEVALGTDANPELPRVDTAPYDPEPAREFVRGLLARRLVNYLGGVLAAVFILYAGILIAEARGLRPPSSLPPLLDLAQAALTPLIGVVGTVLGFYFGSTGRRSR